MTSPIEEIKNRLEIADVIGGYLKLKKAGANLMAVCPFHSEKKPSFFVSPSKQIWKCFGCGKGGNIFDFIMEIEGVEFGDALRILAQQAGVELKRVRPELKSKRQRLYEVSELAAKFYQKQLEASSVGKEAKDYLLGRKISEESIKNWRLGYAPDSWQGLSDFLQKRGYSKDEIVEAGLAIRGEGNKFYDRFRGRIMFPVFDFNSQVIGFGARIFESARQKAKAEKQENMAKYLNTPNTLLYDKSYTLYGLNNAKVDIRKENSCILVEGYTDVILSHQAGAKNAVSASGTALTPYQLNILKRYSDNLVLSFDMDVAGDTATKRGIGLAQEKGFNIKVLIMPEDNDAADVISRNPEEWQEIIKNAQEILDFYFKTTLAKLDRKTPEGKKEIAKILLPVLKRISNKIVRFHWIQKLAQELETRESDIEEELAKVKAEEEKEEKNQPENSSKTGQNQEELLEKEILLLALGDKENINFLSEEDFIVFSSETVQALKSIKQFGLDFEKLKQELPLEIFERLQMLSLERDVREAEENPKEEMEKCLALVRFLRWKKECRRLEGEIREAEKMGHQEKVEILKKEFSERIRQNNENPNKNFETLEKQE